MHFASTVTGSFPNAMPVQRKKPPLANSDLQDLFMSHPDQPTDPIDVIAENEEVFRTIREKAEDSTVAEQFGTQPLRLLELEREREDQE
jgi:hypothetical protein